MDEDSEQKGLLEDEQTSSRRSLFDKLKGITAGFITVILHGVGATSFQLLERRIPDLELNMFRSVAPFIMYSFYFLIKCNWPIIERGKIGITALYIVTSFTSILCYFVAVSLLPAALVSCIATASCWLSGLVLLSCVGEERITLKRILFAAICIFGVIMVIQPWHGNKMEEADVIMRAHVINSTNSSRSVSVSVSHVTEQPNHVDITASQITQDSDVRVPTENSTGTSFNRSKSERETDTEGNETAGMILGYSLAVLNGVTVVFHPLIIKRSNQFITDHFHEVIFWCFASFTSVSFVLSFAVEKPVLPSTCVCSGLAFLYSGTKVNIRKHIHNHINNRCHLHVNSSVHSAVIYSTWTQKLDGSCRSYSRFVGMFDVFNFGNYWLNGKEARQSR